MERVSVFCMNKEPSMFPFYSFAIISYNLLLGLDSVSLKL